MSFVAALLVAAVGMEEPIRMARTPDVSPDGKLVCFSYQGDIWLVDAIGGVARPVTTHRAHDINPVFSPDGKYIAFSSTRHGNYDVFVIPTQSGKPRRLTFDSSPDMVCGWTPDGQHVLFASTRALQFPQVQELYTVPVEGGRVQRITVAEGKDGNFSPSGDRLAYVRGPGTWYRKGYRGSSNDEIWLADRDGQNNRRLTTFVGQDTSPMWSADGQTLYYVSEEPGGPANIVKLPAVTSPTMPRPEAVTKHADESVRKARISRDGKWIVYECGFDLWITSTQGNGAPRKLAIEVHTDDKSNTERMETFTANATEFAVSPDENHMVLALHGELFLMPTTPGARAKRLTTTQVNNHGVSWASDGAAIVFISDRDGHDNIYKLEAAEPVGAKLAAATSYKTTQLTTTKEAILGVGFAPDGKKLAFLRGGALWTMSPDGTDEKQLIREGRVFDYEWSPDSKWLCYARSDASFASELYIIPAAGPTAENPARNVTRYATFNGGVTWSASGNTLAFLSSRKGAEKNSLYVLPVRKPAGPGVATGVNNPVAIDWDDIAFRVQQVLPLPVEYGVIGPTGGQLAIRMANPGNERGSDLWLVNSSGSQLTRLTTGNQQPQQIQWSKRGFPATIYFRDKDGNIKLVRPSIDPKGEASVVTLLFSIKLHIKAADEFQEMFDQAWRILANNFYDSKFHGSDWNAVRERYRPVVKHLTMKEDLFALLFLMMGELNASHLGVSNTLMTAEEPTADLGVIVDEFTLGKGLKILDIVKRGPADQRGITLKAGELIMAIDGTPLTETTNVARLLNGKTGQTVVLLVAANPTSEPKTWRRVEIQAVARDATNVNTPYRELVYERWVAQNAAKVSELSGGKYGYIHIPGMDEAGLDRFVRALYSDSFDRAGIVLDVRFNGGGFTHERVMNYLNAKEHTFFRQRDGSEGLVLRSGDRKWTRPVVLLINNRSYSDAEIFPNMFRTLGVGKLVGEPTGGFVIGTTSTRLIDGSTFRMPRTGVFRVDGVNMDREGVKPDVLVEPHPNDLGKGEDAQLATALKVLAQEVEEWRKNRPAKKD